MFLKTGRLYKLKCESMFGIGKEEDYDHIICDKGSHVLCVEIEDKIMKAGELFALEIRKIYFLDPKGRRVYDHYSDDSRHPRFGARQMLEEIVDEE
jgi:hypothetical protein